MTIGVPVALGNNNGTTGTTIAITSTAADSAVGTLNVIAVGVANTLGATSVTDNAGTPNTYTGTTDETNTDAARMFFSNITSDLAVAKTITMTAATGIGKGILGVNVTGVVTTSPLDVNTGSNGISAAPNVSSGVFSQANEIVFATMTIAALSVVITEDTTDGWISLGTFNFGPAATMHVAYQIVAATTAISYKPTWTGSHPWAIAIASFKGASAATPGAFLPLFYP